MKLEPTRVEHVYEVGDESGYRFTVTADYEPEWGWSAQVVMKSHGYKTPEAAIAHMRSAAEAFLRQTEGLK